MADFGSPDIWGGSAVVRHRPPREYVKDLGVLEHTCETGPEAAVQHGWQIDVTVDPAHTHDGKYHSGDTLTGKLHVKRIDPEAKKIASIVARLFWQSTCLYKLTTFVLRETASTGSKVKKLTNKMQPNVNSYEKVVEVLPDWHRGFAAPGEAGVELWHGGELDEVAHQVHQDFPHLNLSDNSSPVNGMAHDTIPPPPSSEDRHEVELENDSTMNFAFKLPTTTRVKTANRLERAHSDRRRLQLFQRTPPPSCPTDDFRMASVEWAVEVIVTLHEPEVVDDAAGGEEASTDDIEEDTPHADEALPTFGEAMAAHRKADEYGLLTPSPRTLVVRKTFQFEPKDSHNQPLHTAWRPSPDLAYISTLAENQGIPMEEIWDETPVEASEEVPSIGKDVRGESLGGIPIGTKGTVRSALVAQEGGRLAWCSFEKRLATRSLGKAIGIIRAEGSIARSLLLSRDSEALPILLHLSYNLPPGSTKLKAKTISFTHVTACLSMRLTSRGGPKAESILETRELRKMRIPLTDATLSEQTTRMSVLSSRSTSGKEDGEPALKLALGQSADIKLLFDMQSDLEPVEICRNRVRLRDCGISFRTPNIEREYVLTARLHPRGEGEFYFIRAPIQVIAGSPVMPPSFDTVVASPPEYRNVVANQ